MKLRTVGLMLLFSTAFTLSACGQKGPLYMPKKEAPAATAPAAEEQATEQTEDKASGKDEADNTGK
jgi:predicted small lipoprotein YifL